MNSKLNFLTHFTSAFFIFGGNYILISWVSVTKATPQNKLFIILSMAINQSYNKQAVAELCQPRHLGHENWRQDK